jgi:prepilin-type N-terminal cleavage/methylation domain-containing protein
MITPSRAHLSRIFRPSCHPRRAFTLVEMAVSIAIMAFLFTFCAYLTFMMGLSMYSIHEQVMAQSSASNAMERTTYVLRNATKISPFDADKDTSGELDRARFATPLDNDISKIQWGKIQFAKNDRDANGTLQIFMNESGTAPDFSFPNIKDFGITVQSDNHVTLKIDYTYRGASRGESDKNHDGIPDSMLSGSLNCDIVAKNFSTYGGHKDDDTTTTEKS